MLSSTLDKLNRLFRKESAFFIVYPLLVLLLYPAIRWCEPDTFSINLIENSTSVYPLLRSTLFIILIGVFLLFFHYFPFKGSEKIGKIPLLDLLATLFFTIGYSNLLFGFIPSLIGYILFFIIGILILLVKNIAQKRKPLFTPRGIIILLAIFIGYASLSLLWSNSPNLGEKILRNWVWLFIIPFLFSIYPPSSLSISLFFRLALRIGYIYIVALFFIYAQTCLSIDAPLDVAFTFNKGYLLDHNGFGHHPALLLLFFGNQHYTILVLLLLTPYLLALLKGKSFSSLLLYGIGLMLYVFILQSRAWILLTPALIGITLLLRWVQNNIKWVLLSLAFVGIVSLFPISKKLGFFNDQLRKEAINIALNHLEEKIIFGHGIGSSRAILESDGSPLLHFHNSYLTIYYELGIMGIAILFAILILLCIEAKRKENYLVLLLLLSSFGFMMIDQFFVVVNLFTSIMFMLTLSIYCQDSTLQRGEKGSTIIK